MAREKCVVERRLSGPFRKAFSLASGRCTDRRWDHRFRALFTGKGARLIVTAGSECVVRCGINGPVDDLRDREPASTRSRPPFSELGHIGLVDLPIEEIVVARPRVDQAAAHFAGEAAGTPGRLFFLCRAVGQRATGTAEIFDGEETACHSAMMLRARRLSSRTGCDSQRPATRIVEAGGVRDSDFLTRRIRGDDRTGRDHRQTSFSINRQGFSLPFAPLALPLRSGSGPAITIAQ
jgi:hypothetical protein